MPRGKKTVNLEVKGNAEEFKIEVVKDIEPELIDIHKERLENKETNGFSPNKTLRRVAFIPIEALLALGKEGFDLLNDTTPEKLKKFLERHPEFKLVDHL